MISRVKKTVPELITTRRIGSGLLALERDIKKRFTIADTVYKTLARKMAKIVETGENTEAIQAARVLLAMAEFNASQEPKTQQQVEHHHTHELGPVTADNIEQHKAIRLARLAEFVPKSR